MFRIAPRLALLAAGLAFLVACIEDFQRLTTKIAYDPDTKTLRVEQILHNIDADFFRCTEAAECAAVAARMAKLDVAEEAPPAPPADGAPIPDAPPTDEPSWRQLTGGLVEADAREIAVRFVRTGDQLDAVVTYTADVPSKAAGQAGVFLETVTRGKKSSEYLAISADAEINGLASTGAPALVEPAGAPHRTISSDESDAFQSWILTKKQHNAIVERYVDDDVQPIFTEIPGFDEAMRAAGLL